MLRTISEKALFGTKPVWRGQVKVSVSDPSCTILDMLIDPKLGGGIRSTTDMFSNYLKSENTNIELLIEYAKRLNNGAVFKRLGLLLEKYTPDQKIAIDKCRARLTKGYVKLDPALKAKKLILHAGGCGCRKVGQRRVDVIDRQEIMDFSREFGLTANIIEKDYVLGWLLAHPDMLLN